MAQKVQVLLVDDVDGGTADETVKFALDGVTYEIDLTAANAEKLRDSLAPWTGHARKGTGRGFGAKPAPPRPRHSRAVAQEIRGWAKWRGHHVSERGRISAEVRAAYEAAH